MKRKAGYWTLFISALAALPTAWAESHPGEARQWLERMIHATQTLNYEGNFVYVQGQNLEAMHITHGSNIDGERQRMVSLNGTAREVVVANNRVMCNKVVVSNSYSNRSSFPISLPRNLTKLEENYQFTLLNNDRIAGRETRVVAIKPRDELRFGYRLWLDNETGMVLRSALLDETGQIAEQMMFTQLNVMPTIDPALLASVKPSLTGTGAANENVVQSDWVVSALPAGFEKVMQNHFSPSPSPSPSRHPTEHMVFTDGLVTVSVFIEPLLGAEPLFTGASRMGAMNAFGTVIANHQAIVVGEVPEATLRLIAAGLQYTGKVTGQ